MALAGLLCSALSLYPLSFTLISLVIGSRCRFCCRLFPLLIPELDLYLLAIAANDLFAYNHAIRFCLRC